MASMVASSRPSASNTTAQGFPASGRSVNASTQTIGSVGISGSSFGPGPGRPLVSGQGNAATGIEAHPFAFQQHPLGQLGAGSAAAAHLPAGIDDPLPGERRA